MANAERKFLPNIDARFQLRSCCVVSWDSRFEEPIVLPYGIRLASLRAAIIHMVVTVPKAERSMPAVRRAADMLTNAAEHGGLSSAGNPRDEDGRPTVPGGGPSKKRSPQKCSNCGGEGHTARTCTKGATHVRSDVLPLTAL